MNLVTRTIRAYKQEGNLYWIVNVLAKKGIETQYCISTPLTKTINTTKEDGEVIEEQVELTNVEIKEALNAGLEKQAVPEKDAPVIEEVSLDEVGKKEEADEPIIVDSKE
jgi:hypothetical protein